MVDHLIMIDCFVKKKYSVTEWKAADMNKEVNCTDPYPSVRIPWLNQQKITLTRIFFLMSNPA